MSVVNAVENGPADKASMGDRSRIAVVIVSMLLALVGSAIGLELRSKSFMPKAC